MTKFSGEVGIKCHQSYSVALVFCTKLYKKLAVSLSSFSQFSFPFNFQTANALVLKFGTLPLRCLFSNTLLAIFDIFFRSKVIHRFVPKNGPKKRRRTNRLRRRTSDQTVLGSNPAVAAALSPWTRLFTPVVPRRSLHISFY